MSRAEEYARWIVQNADKRGTPDFDTVARAYQAAREMEQQQASALLQPDPPQEGNSLGRQIGLTARAGVKGLAALPAIGADAIGGLVNMGAQAVGSDFRFKPTTQTIDDLLTRAGLPQPRTKLERIAQTGAEMMSGAGAAAGAAKAMSGAVASPTAQAVLTRLARDPTQQIVSAGAAGVAGKQAEEAGAGGFGQFVSAVGGGLAGAGALGAGRATVDAAQRLMPRAAQVQLARVDQAINVSLQSGGIDPATITPAMRNALREQVGKAMQLGELDEKAIQRLADYTRLNLTPTRARLTLDPFDVTQEENARRIAAATGARDAKLPTILQQNNQRLLGAVDAFEPIPDSLVTGARAMAPIQARDRAMAGAKAAAYNEAEAMAGGNIPLQRGPLNEVWGKLEAARKLRFLPAEISATINDVLSDTRAPFDVNTLDALKTTIATAQRGTLDGNVKAALKIVRDHLDSMPLTPEKRTFGGNQLVTEAGAATLREADGAAQRLKDQLDRARGLNFDWMRWRESAPGIAAAVEDANPEQFVRNFIRSPSADARDVARVAAVINTDPGARQAVRQEIVQTLKDAAIGRGNDSATGNFSGRQWLSALASINRKKLELFFDADEIEQLRAIGRVGTLETFQPRGSAVANSNTPAGMAGLIQGVLKYAKPVANKLPLGTEIISNPLENMTLSLLQRGATNIPRSLLAPQIGPKGSLLDPFVLPSVVGVGGLLAPQ